MNENTVLFAAVAFGICSFCARAQIAGTSASAAPEKQIDIGAADAPLSNTERVDLDNAVRKHDYVAEKAIIDKVMTEHQHSFELLVMAGRLAYLEKKAKDAADALESADKINPLGETDRVTLALAYAFSQQPAQSRGELQQLMKTAPRNAEYPYLLGRIELENHRLEEAASDFSKAIQLDPDMVRAYEDLGQAQESLGRMDESRKTYEAGAVRNREKKIYWEWSPVDLGVVVLKSGDVDAAEKLFREALQYNPRFGWAHYYMGQLFQTKGDIVAAVAEYKEAVVDEPRLRQAWLALGREFTREGHTAEAGKALAIFKQLENENNARKGRKN